MNWDEDRAAIARSEELGWQAVIAPAVFADANGDRSVTIEFTDASGEPITGLLVHTKAWHHAIGKIVEGDAVVAPGAGLQGAGMQVAGGTYRVDLPMEQAGFWDFEVTATRGSDAFVSQTTLTVTSAASLLGTPGH